MRIQYETTVEAGDRFTCIREHEHFTVGKTYQVINTLDPYIVMQCDSGTDSIFLSSVMRCFKKADLTDEPVTPVTEKVSHPSHYSWLKEKCGIEPVDIVRHLDFDTGNAVKYLLRHGRKSEQGMSGKEKAIEDLKKAVWYIKDRIKMLQDEQESIF